MNEITMPAVATSAEALFNSLRDATKDERRVRNLTILWNVLQAHRANGSKDFRISTIARLSKAANGPLGQTMRNKAGADFRALIEAVSAEVEVIPSKTSLRTGGVDGDLLAMIDDAAARAHVGIILAEVRSLRRQVSDLKKALSKEPLVVGDDHVVAAVAALPSVAADAIPTPAEASAIRQFLEDIPERGWEVNEDCEIVTSGGEVIATAGLVRWLRRAVR